MPGWKTTASINGVHPSPSATSTLAPRSTNTVIESSRQKMAATLGKVWPSIVLALGSPPSSIHCLSTETLPKAVAVKMCLGSAERAAAAMSVRGVAAMASGAVLETAVSRWPPEVQLCAGLVVGARPRRGPGAAVAVVLGERRECVKRPADVGKAVVIASTQKRALEPASINTLGNQPFQRPHAHSLQNAAQTR